MTIRCIFLFPLKVNLCENVVNFSWTFPFAWKNLQGIRKKNASMFFTNTWAFNKTLAELNKEENPLNSNKEIRAQKIYIFTVKIQKDLISGRFSFFVILIIWSHLRNLSFLWYVCYLMFFFFFFLLHLTVVLATTLK